jgi:hypothetical protein
MDCKINAFKIFLVSKGYWDKLVEVYTFCLRPKNIHRINSHHRSKFIASARRTESLTSRLELDNFLSLIRPIRTEFELIRVGGMSDGGYLVPDILDSIDCAISPGVASTATFELDLVNRGIPCFLADYSVDEPPFTNLQIDFEKKYIGTEDTEMFMTLDSWLNKKNIESYNLLLQMDIEGAEWQVLESVSRDTLNKFRILVIEFHSLHHIFLQFSYERILNLFEKLMADFFVVHFHPNNNDGLCSQFGINIPPTVEITFLRKDLANHVEAAITLTNSLDVQNSNWKPKIFAEDTFGVD